MLKSSLIFLSPHWIFFFSSTPSVISISLMFVFSFYLNPLSYLLVSLKPLLFWWNFLLFFYILCPGIHLKGFSLSNSSTSSGENILDWSFILLAFFIWDLGMWTSIISSLSIMDRDGGAEEWTCWLVEPRCWKWLARNEIRWTDWTRMMGIQDMSPIPSLEYGGI